MEDRTLLSITALTPAVTDGLPGSLRTAIIADNNDMTMMMTDTIQLDDTPGATVTTYSLTLQNRTSGHETASKTGDLNITNTKHSLIIEGMGTSPSQTVIDQTVLDRVFEIAKGVSVTFENLVIEGGTAEESGGSGSKPGTPRHWAAAF